MNKTRRNAYSFLLACALLSGAATFARAGAGDEPAAEGGSQSRAVAGTYRLKTYRPGKEGYDNTLEVKEEGGGKLHVSLSGTYIYQANGEETMHEASGEGDATLRGNVATASLTPDGEDSPCRVTIIFDGDEAGVKAGRDCNFNITLDGTYVNENRAARPAAATSATAAGPRQVRYDRLEDFVDDSQKNRTGLRYVIMSVPAEKVGKITPAGAGQRGLFYLMAGEDDTGASSGFVTSAALVRSLRSQDRRETASLRVTATLVEFQSELDVYRMSFVTKIEGLGEDGSVIWSAAGAEPARVKMRQ